MSFILDGRILPLDVAFTHNEQNYGPQWLRHASPEERAAIGIIEVPDYPRPDDRFFWVTMNMTDGTYTATPKDLAGLKSIWAAQMRQTAYTLLLPSDWMVVRQTETGAPVPAGWTTYRAAVRVKAADTVAAIEAAADINAFIAVVTSVVWPVSPDSQEFILSRPE